MASRFLPANSHPPDVVDNPVEDTIDNYAVEVSEQPAPTMESGMQQGNYSEIPGWKPKPTPTPAPAENIVTESPL
jgi:hypothetical protein